MTFDVDTFSALLKVQAEEMTAYSRSVKATLTSKEVGHLKLRGAVSTAPVVYVCGMHNHVLSNHEKILHEAFITARLADIKTMKHLLKTGIPALDHDDLRFDVSVVCKGKREVRMALTVLDIPISSNSGMGCAAITNKLLCALGRIAHLPKPENRVFQIENRTMRAANPEAAYRIWAALSAPDIFEPQNNAMASVCPPDIHEIIPGTKAHAALLT